MNVLFMMQEIMGLVVTNVSEDPTAEDGSGGEPIPEEDGVGEFEERDGEDEEEGWWHDEAVLIHWQEVVDAVEEEVCCDSDTVVGEVPTRVDVSLCRSFMQCAVVACDVLVNVEETPVHPVLHQRPQ